MAENNHHAWHLDKTVSIGHILSTLIIALSIFSWGLAIDKRVEQNSQSIGFLSENQRRVEVHVESTRTEIRQDLSRINQKLDRLVERQVNN